MRKLRLDELGRLDVDSYKKIKKIPVIIVLDNVRSMHNVGSVFRTSDAFLVQKIYLCGITAKPPHKEIRKTAIGATESVDWEYRDSATDLVKELTLKGYQIVCVEQTSKSVSLEQFTAKKDQQYVLVFGNEVDGVQDSIIQESSICIDLPQFGTKHSLNVSVCAGIVLWEFAKAYKL